MNYEKQPIPDNLRVADLVAKTARVTLKDTLRVCNAVAAVLALYGEEGFLNALETTDTTRPKPENVAACEQASFTMYEGNVSCRDDLDIILDRLDMLT